MHDLPALVERAPLLAEAPQLQRAMLQAARALSAGGRAWLPAAQGVQPAALARWLQRLRIEAEGRWLPLLHVDAAWLDSPTLDAAHQLAAGGLLFIEGPVAELPALPGVAVLGEAEGEPLPLRREAAARLAWEDGHHALIVDPALAALRRSLLSHCRGASVVHLEGEPGTGRGELARWAHGVLDDRPLSVLGRGGGRPEPGQWLLVEELGELGADGREQLTAALRARQPPPPPPPPLGARLRRPHHRAFKPILGRSPALAAVLHQALEVAEAELPVLILGDPGTGKESLARAVHEASGRRGAFVPVDLGALPARLAESELFGHVRGAFTGAERDREGAFRAADGGTLFLDELGNLPLALQVKLLRALQERRVRPLGADRDLPVDVRVVAATNADLESQVRQGRFRADLLGRLDAVVLRLPPLRERSEDIPLLAERFLQEARGEGACFSEAALALLRAHDWPGNIRELRNLARLAAATAPEGSPVPPEALGPLAPGRRRPTPLLVTSGGDAERWGLDRAQAQTLRAVTLRVPPLRDRGPLSLRSHVLAGLCGRPIQPEALACLERLPWWGNLPRLRAALSALRSATQGLVDLEALSEHLPHLLEEESAAPIRALIGPVEEADGGVGGLREDFHQASVLIGRAPSLRGLREMARGPEGERVAVWLDEIDSVSEGVEPALLSLGLLPRLSRAHALLTREAGGLRVHALSGARLPLEAGPIGGRLRVVPPGASQPLGEAGELRVLHARGGVYLQLFVFLGELAFAEQAQAAVVAARGADIAAQETVLRSQVSAPAARPALTSAARPGWTPSAAPQRAPLPGVNLGDPFSVTPMTSTSPPPESLKGGGRVWTLSSAEVRALAAILARHPGGQFKAWVQHQLPALERDPALGALALYFKRAPRVAQYAARLLLHPENAPARQALVAALIAAGEPRARLARLPKGVREAVSSQLDARLSPGVAPGR